MSFNFFSRFSCRNQCFSINVPRFSCRNLCFSMHSSRFSCRNQCFSIDVYLFSFRNQCFSIDLLQCSCRDPYFPMDFHRFPVSNPCFFKLLTSESFSPFASDSSHAPSGATGSPESTAALPIDSWGSRFQPRHLSPQSLWKLSDSCRPWAFQPLQPRTLFEF